MQYISTRGQAPKLNFKETFLTGLASDGGLYVPEYYPQISTSEIASWQKLDYVSLCYEIFRKYTGNTIKAATLKKLIAASYNDKFFHHSAIAPLKQFNEKLFLLELFHGETLAFKDFALQLMGNFLEHFLKENKEKAVILGATSGDTGSAAINGCKHAKNADIYILHPYQRTSEIQRKQMTSVTAKNVFNIAIEGNFDDCQNIVKTIFVEQDFLKGQKRLIAVNSINWLRIMSQIVYYFYAAFRLGAPFRRVSFAVPTGNFGDIFAGYVAKQMGLPIDKLIIATNKNDILHRFIRKNSYNMSKLEKSLSPSMDIQISSNFERLLFAAHNNDATQIATLMTKFKKTGKLSVAKPIHQKICTDFLSSSCSDADTTKIMQQIAKATGEIIDPHTATAIAAYHEHGKKLAQPFICLATAHPGKFPAALTKAKLTTNLPKRLADCLDKTEKYDILPDNQSQVVNYITKHSL